MLQRFSSPTFAQLNGNPNSVENYETEIWRKKLFRDHLLLPSKESLTKNDIKTVTSQR